MKQKIFITIVLLSLSVTLLQAQRFQQSHIEKATTALHVDSTLLVTPGLHHFKAKDMDVAMRVSQDSVVEHIGVPLFGQNVRVLVPSPIYDFLEYIVLDHHFRINDNSLRQHEISFIKGSWRQLELLGDSLPTLIENLEEKTYQVTWQREGVIVCSVKFPINYELLANSTRREIERTFLRDLKAFKPTAMQQSLAVDSAGLTPSVVTGVFKKEGTSQFIPTVTNSLYFLQGKDGNYRLLADNRHPAESMANLLVAPIDLTNGAEAQIKILLSDYSNEQFTLPLQQLLSFCRTQGCEPYFGFEEVNKGNAIGTLLMVNRASGYLHIMHVHCPTNAFGSAQPVDVQIYLYVPTSNIRSLFGNHINDTKSLIIWK